MTIPGNWHITWISLKIDHIKRLIQEVKYCSLVNLNILGGDIFRYPKLERLVTLTTALQTQKNYYLHYLNAYANRNRLKSLAASDSRLKILVTFPARKEKLKLAIDAAVQSNLHFTLCFIIQGKKEFEEAEALVELFQVNKVEFFAFYNSSNTDFFKKNIYVDREDIGENRPTLKDIYTMGVVNSLDFGHLVILPNSRIYANVNKPSLGLMGKHSIYEIVLKEMKCGKSWHRIRKNVLPCKRCTFEMLCPPISNYNIIIGKNNLCHIWQDPDLT